MHIILKSSMTVNINYLQMIDNLQQEREARRRFSVISKNKIKNISLEIKIFSYFDVEFYRQVYLIN